MTELQQELTEQAKSPSQVQDDDAINLLDYIEVVLKRWKMIAMVTALAFFLSIIVSLLQPKIYSSTARILPPQQDQNPMSVMAGQLGGLASLASGMIGGVTTGDLYVGLLKSEAVKGSIIDRFKLMDLYGIMYRLDAYNVLDEIVKLELGKKDGIISIIVEGKDPKLVAAIANGYVDELAKLTVELNISGAGQTRSFLEERLVKANADLVKAEESLKTFQTKNKTFDVPEQAKASIEGVAQLKAQLAIQQAQLAAIRSRLTDSTQEVRDQRAAIANIRSQIAGLEGSGGSSAIPPMGSVPALGQEYLRLMREFKIQDSLVELLTKQYEMAKLSEAKYVSGVQVIQKAEVPDKKIKPKRTLMVLGGTFVTFFIAVILAFVLEYTDRMTMDDRKRWRKLRGYLPKLNR